jgi:hypothetical protein
MNRLCIGTRGIGSWRERLASPDRQWERGFSAFETAVSWELASRSESGIPEPIEKLLRASGYGDPVLVLAVAEHKVDLPPNRKAASQSDVWAVVNTSLGMLSLTVEAKAKEAFGDAILQKWREGNGSEASKRNRLERWNFLCSHLPKADSFDHVRYQMLHRCASAVIEAKRLGIRHAAFVVQAFGAPTENFRDYAMVCDALKIASAPGSMATTAVNDIRLSIGWADCPLASDSRFGTCVVVDRSLP